MASQVNVESEVKALLDSLNLPWVMAEGIIYVITDNGNRVWDFTVPTDVTETKPLYEYPDSVIEAIIRVRRAQD